MEKQMQKLYNRLGYVYLVSALYCFYIEKENTAYFFVAMIFYSQIKEHLYRIEEKINESK
jgi:hypothetical protein